MTNKELLIWINKMQDILGSKHINSIDDNWKIFYELDDKSVKGFCVLCTYHRLPYKDDYDTGKLAEIDIFTFPEYRHQGVCSRLIKQALEYANNNKIDIVADAADTGYEILKSFGFKDSIEHRIWMKFS